MFLLLLRGGSYQMPFISFSCYIEFYIGGLPAGRVELRTASQLQLSAPSLGPSLSYVPRQVDTINGRPQPRCLWSEGGGSSIPRRGHATRLQ